MLNDIEHKLSQAKTLKQKGNDFYLQKEYVQALRAYHQANLYLAGLIDKSSPMAMYSKDIVDEETSNLIKQIKFSILMNMAQIYIHQQKHEKGLNTLRKASQIKENNKLHYRMGICLMNEGYFQEARLKFSKVVETDPTMKQEIDKHLKNIQTQESKANQKSKNMFKKFFQH